MSTTPDHLGTSKRPLEPIERISEALFGLLMVLTYTTAITVGPDEGDAVRTMLKGALGCNLAWGLIDALFYLMGCMAERSRGLLKLRVVRGTADAQEARRIIDDALPPAVSAILQPAELESIYQRLRQLPEPSGRVRLRKEEWLGAVGVFLWVFIITFPVATPFMFMRNVDTALHVSNGIGIALLFGLGYAYGSYTGLGAWLRGVAWVFIGAALVALCRVLGG